MKTRTDFVIQSHQSPLFTPQFKAISECRQKKFSQAEIPKQTKPQSCITSSTANSRLVRAKGGF